jgi:hypothetical protein
MRGRWIRSVVITAAVMFLAAGAAHAAVIQLTGAGTSPDGPVSASATVTTGTNSITVVLNDLLANPTSVGQTLSDIFLTLSDTPSAVSLTSSAGTLINIGAGGVVTPDGTVIDHWGTALVSGSVHLAAVGTGAPGGQPHDLIIGPPGAGGVYTAGNASITNGMFSPFISQTGTFVISATGVSAATTVTAASFSFGTGPDFVTPGTPSVPEPTTALLLGSAFLALTGVAKVINRRRKTE